MYRILIVEDDRTIAQALKRHLSGWDYEVYCVEDFKNVMEEFSNVQPDLVLLDIGLPFIMAITGAAVSAGFPMCPLFSVSGRRQYEYCYGYEYGRR